MPLGCGCLYALCAASLTRMALLLTWLLTPLVRHAFQSGFAVPYLGLLFLPLTTLTYSVVWSPVAGIAGWGWLGITVGLVIDVTSLVDGAFGNRGPRVDQYGMPA